MRCVATPALPDALTFRGPADTERVAAIAHDIDRGDVSGINLAIPRRRTWPLPMYELACDLRTVTDIPSHFSGRRVFL